MSSAPSRSSRERPHPLATLSDVADDLLAPVRALSAATPVVLLDGRSGAGKSTVARMLCERWGAGVQVLAMDEMYPGWGGLAAASRMLSEQVLPSLAAGQPGIWRRWDWAREAPGREGRVEPGRPLIVEGAGAVTTATAPLAHLRIWLSGSESLRRERALARDGAAYAPFWRMWADQEDRHVRMHDPEGLADRVYAVSASSIARTRPSSRYPSHS